MKYIFVGFGTLSLLLGFLGVFLPILPTTPFILLSTYFYSKSSTKINDSFKESKIYQKYLHDFEKDRSMTRKSKWILLVFVDTIMLISFISLNNFFLRLVLIFLFLLKHWYFYKFIKIRDK